MIPLFRTTVLLLCIFLIIINNWSCKTVPSYTESNHPIWKDNSISAIPRAASQPLKVISFNIEFSREIDQAIEELETHPKLKNADILLLQEMDEAGTKMIAQALGYNYLYFPFTFDVEQDKNLGNAILSKYPLLDELKIILPHAKISNKKKRMATVATIEVNDKKILICSVHLDTILLKRSKRLEQSQFLAEELCVLNQENQIDYAIIGGDFNTLLKNYRTKVIDHYTSTDLDWATKEVGATGSEVFGWLQPANDHIFTKGFEVLEAGKNPATTASDHYPVWIDIAFEE